MFEIPIENLFVLVPFGIVLTVMVVYVSGARKVREQFLAQANKRNGRVTGGFILPQLILSFDNTTVSLTETVMAGKRNKPQVTMTLSLEMKSAIVLEVHTRNTFDDIIHQLAYSRRLESGDPVFDEHFKIQTYNDAVVQQFFTSDVVQAFNDIKSFKPTMQISQGQFVLRAPAPLASEQDYDKFIRVGLTLARRAKQLCAELHVVSPVRPRPDHDRPVSPKNLPAIIVTFAVTWFLMISSLVIWMQYSNRSVVSKVRHWPHRDMRNWNPLPASIESMKDGEYAYWSQWCEIMNEGVNNRMNVDEGLNKKRSADYYRDLYSQYRSRQERMLKDLQALAPPERIEIFHEKVISAGYDQMAFYEFFLGEKLRSKYRTMKQYVDNADLKTTDKKLWAAYYDFQALYPERSRELNDAIERRLAWFDMI